MSRAVGIDLGTTNSYVAHVTNGQAEVILQPTGERALPSVFTVDADGQSIVGEAAKALAQQQPQDTIAISKRLLGRNLHSKSINDIRQIFTYELVEGLNQSIMVKIRNKVFSLEEISASILRRLREVATNQLQEDVHEVVITVPAYFNDRQRQAVQNAANLADLKLLRMINEPTAAALAYGFRRNIHKRIAIYDLGGGTFDVSIIDIQDTVFEVVASGGNPMLGGVDFDDRLMQYIMEQFFDQFDIDLAIDRYAVQKIRDAAEEAKIRLSDTTNVRIFIENITQEDNESIDLDMVLSREKLEELTIDLVQATISSCKKILTEADFNLESIDEFLLVGGQSRMPLVQRSLHDFIGFAPSQAVHPDEAVALGAALMAHSLTDQENEDLALQDVLPTSIGLRRADGSMRVLFAKNTPLPCQKTKKLCTFKDQQQAIMIRLYQGENKEVAENEEVGTYIFNELRAAPKGKVIIDVSFSIDESGMLHVTATDRETKQPIKTLYTPSTTENVRQSTSDVPQVAEKDRPANHPEQAIASMDQQPEDMSISKVGEERVKEQLGHMQLAQDDVQHESKASEQSQKPTENQLTTTTAYQSPYATDDDPIPHPPSSDGTIVESSHELDLVEGGNPPLTTAPIPPPVLMEKDTIIDDEPEPDLPTEQADIPVVDSYPESLEKLHSKEELEEDIGIHPESLEDLQSEEEPEEEPPKVNVTPNHSAESAVFHSSAKDLADHPNDPLNDTEEEHWQDSDLLTSSPMELSEQSEQPVQPDATLIAAELSTKSNQIEASFFGTDSPSNSAQPIVPAPAGIIQRMLNWFRSLRG